MTYDCIVISVARRSILNIKNQGLAKTCLYFVPDGEIADNEFKIKFPSNKQAKVTTKPMQQSLPYKPFVAQLFITVFIRASH